jgi:hypothetical protein
MKKLALIVGWLISLMVVFWLTSISLYRNQFAAFGLKLDEFQAEFALNHMARYKEIESDLSKGCFKEAQEKAKISKNQELWLLADFLKRHPNSSASISKLINDRDSKLIEQLKSFKNPYGNSWKGPTCSK